jgi:hypothetical protein
MISVINLSKHDICVGKIGKHFYIKTKGGSIIYLTIEAAHELIKDIQEIEKGEKDESCN